jgi:hypothetical protein
MTRTSSIILGVVAIAAIGVGAYLAYDNVLRGDDVAPLALPSSAPASEAAVDPTAESSPATVATEEPTTSAAPGGSSDSALAGTWTVAEGSETGYRVREQLASLPAESDAVTRSAGRATSRAA